MKHFVITIIDNDKSHYAADKCVESGKKFGLEMELINNSIVNLTLVILEDKHLQT